MAIKNIYIKAITGGGGGFFHERLLFGRLSDRLLKTL